MIKEPCILTYCFEVNLGQRLPPPRMSRSTGRHESQDFLLGGGKCYSRLISKQSIRSFYKLLILKHTWNIQNVVSYIFRFFLTLKCSCLFPAVAVLACSRSLNMMDQ